MYCMKFYKQTLEVIAKFKREMVMAWTISITPKSWGEKFSRGKVIHKYKIVFADKMLAKSLPVI